MTADRLDEKALERVLRDFLTLTWWAETLCVVKVVDERRSGTEIRELINLRADAERALASRASTGTDPAPLVCARCEDAVDLKRGYRIVCAGCSDVETGGAPRALSESADPAPDRYHRWVRDGMSEFPGREVNRCIDCGVRVVYEPASGIIRRVMCSPGPDPREAEIVRIALTLPEVLGYAREAVNALRVREQGADAARLNGAANTLERQIARLRALCSPGASGGNKEGK